MTRKFTAFELGMLGRETLETMTNFDVDAFGEPVTDEMKLSRIKNYIKYTDRNEPNEGPQQ